MKSSQNPNTKPKNPKTKPRKQTASWYGKLFNQLDNANQEPRALSNIDDEPQWIVNLLQELLQQVSPAFPLCNFVEISPRALGLYQGQQCANIFAMDQMINVPIAKQSKALNKLLKVLETNQYLPGIQSACANEPTFLCLDFLSKVEEFEKTLHETFKTALDQPKHTEAVEFFQGFAKGLSKAGISKTGIIRQATATLVYQKLYFHRREVEKLSNFSALRKFLIRNGLSAKVLGGVRRLQKMCERLELNLHSQNGLDTKTA
jgi:hypothetical protein